MAKKNKPKAKVQPTSKEEEAPKQEKVNKPARPGGNKKTWWIALFALLAVCFLVLSPNLNNDLTNWDDESYVKNNPLIRSMSGPNMELIFQENVMGNYHPLTILSYAIDYSILKLDPTIYHASNIILHLLNVVLVFWLFYLISGRMDISFITALLFGMHPMHVEPVAWVSGRKELLYSFFFLGALISYWYYKEWKVKKIHFLIIALVCFVLSLLSKAVAVTLPLVLIAIDYFRDRKWDWILFAEKVPFIALSVVFGMMAVGAQQSTDALQEVQQYSYWQNFFVACYGLTIYTVKLIIPFKLSAFHPYPPLVDGNVPFWLYLMVLPVLALGTLVFLSVKKGKVLLFGALLFVLMILPVIQFIPVGDAIIAERYTYLPYLGLIFIAASLYGKLEDGRSNVARQYRTYARVGLAAWVFVLGIVSWNQSKVWENSGTLWKKVIDAYPEAYIAYNNRGNYLASKGKLLDALSDFNASIKFNDQNSEAFNNRGMIFKIKKEEANAMRDFEKAIQLDPNNYNAHMNRGNIYNDQGNYEQALQAFNRSIEINPKYAKTYQNRAITYKRMKNFEASEKDFKASIVLDPNEPYYYRNLALLYEETKEFNKAIDVLTTAITIDPRFAEGYFDRSRMHAASQMYQEAYRDAMNARKYGKQVNQAYIDQLKGVLGMQ